MFKNTFQSGFLSILYSIGSKPLQIWDKKVRNGHTKRITDPDIQSFVLEIVGTNVSTTYITCPADPRKTLGIKLPYLVMIVKNMKKYLLSIILGLLITSVASARSTGCKEGNCENGFGKWVYTDKTTYEGEWVGTKKNGQGVETWPNGYIYKGEFKNSEWSGTGVLTFPDGSTYDGEWAKGFMNGKGTFTSSDGTQKSGTWKNGKLQE